MIATVITDASVGADGVAGWAGRVIYDGKRRTYTGKLKDKVGSSNDAELAALVNTICLGFKTAQIPMHQILCLQTDNLHVVRVMTCKFLEKGTQPVMSEYQHRCIEVLRKAFEEYKPTEIRMKHVKAHLPFAKRDARHHVQQAMDRLARTSRLK